jgi:hypothetical protein
VSPGATSAARSARLLLLATAFLASGCILFAPSEEDVKNDFAVVVDGANHCTESDQCTLVSAGCPLPCWVSVRQDRAAEVERKGRELVNDFESGGSGCDYECAARGTPSCKSGRCGITE